MMTLSLETKTAANAFRDCSLSFLRHLHVVETDVDVTISGQVSSYYYKQLAQEAILPMLGDRKLRNLVVVAAD